MRIVVDTSVVISAAIRDRAPEELVLLIVSQPDWQWLATQEILEEYLEVISRPKFGLTPEIVDRWNELFHSATTLVTADVAVEFPRDPDDAPLLACALSAGADMLVTGDQDLLDLGQVEGTRILSVAAAVEALREAAEE